MITFEETGNKVGYFCQLFNDSKTFLTLSDHAKEEILPANHQFQF
jgi:hypothetical protein